MNEQLLEQMNDSIKKTVDDKKIGVAFSGGVDSTLVAKLCSRLDYEVTLLTIGFPSSHDILFAKTVNEDLKLTHHILEIESIGFDGIYLKINQKIKTDNLSWNENCVAFYYVSKLAQTLGITTVVTANGIDELFCGYNAYRKVFEKGKNKILELMESKLENEIKMMNAVNDVTAEFEVRIVQPFLSADFVSFAKKIPINQKITSKDDLMRKHAIRNLASDIGIPQISVKKRKKALQYGSLIHKTLLKSR